MMRRFLLVLNSLVVILGFVVLPSGQVSAASFNPNHVIEDSIFEHSSSMSAASIDNLFNGYSSSCISQNNHFSTADPQGFSSGAYQFGGNVSAGQAILDIAQHYDVNPQVIVTTLQKEQSVVTGSAGCYPNTPDSSASQNSPCGTAKTPCTTACPYSGGCLPIAMSYDCPNYCYAGIEGFSNQISGGAWVLRWAEQRAYGILTGYAGYDSGDETFYYGGPMTAGWRQRSSTDSPNLYDGSYTTSDGQSLTIANGSTASLYSYTPSVSGSTSFFNIFSGWFGSPVNVCGNDPVDQPITSHGHVPGDFIGNGVTGAAVFRPSDGCWHVRGYGDVLFGQTGDIPVPADYNGDGKTDIAVFRPGQLINGQVAWHIRGVGDFAYGLPGDIPVPADYNGDGSANIAVYRPSQIVNGQTTWHIRGVGDFYFGQPGDIPVPADYCHDGWNEIAVFRPSTGDWHIRGNLDYGGHCPGGDIHAYGQNGDIPVPGNYSGAGTNAAVYRPEQGGWHIRAFGDFPYGYSTDIPVPGNYAGGSTTGAAVFRPSTGDWHLRGVGDYWGYGQNGDIPAISTLNAYLLQQYGLISSY